MRSATSWALGLLLLSSAVYGQQPAILGEAALAIDVDTSEIIFQRDIDRQLHPASTTKLLTALLLAENREREHVITYTAEAANAYPYRLGLDVGDRLTAHEAMKAVLLPSGNDIAVAIAQDVAGSVPEFSRMMNARAAQIGMTDSHFVNPTGLHDPDHVTTPYDLSLLARVLYGYPWIMEVMSLARSTVTPLDREPISVRNRNKLTGVRGCVGGKTGWTTPAGRCLVALYERNGRRMVGIVMKSVLDAEDTFVFQDMEALMAWSYAAERLMAIPAGATVHRVSTLYRPLPVVPARNIEIALATRRDAALHELAGQARRRVSVDNPLRPWRLRRDQRVGTLEIIQRERVDAYALYPTISWLDLLRENRAPYTLSLLLLYGIVAAAVVLLRMPSPD